MGMIKSYKDLGFVDGKYRTHYVMDDGKEIITEVAKDLLDVFGAISGRTARLNLERGILETEGLASRDEFKRSIDELNK